MGPTFHRLGRFEVLATERVLLEDGAPLPLGPRAFDVLLVLVERRGQLVTKSELLEAVWPGVFVEENNLQVQVSAIRKVLGRDAIATIPGRGYQLTLPAEGMPEPPLPPAPSTLCLALLVAERGRFENAARLFGHSRRIYTNNALPPEPAELKVTERAQRLLRAALSEADFERLAAEGSQLDERAALALSGIA